MNHVDLSRNNRLISRRILPSLGVVIIAFAVASTPPVQAGIIRATSTLSGNGSVGFDQEQSSTLLFVDSSATYAQNLSPAVGRTLSATATAQYGVLGATATVSGTSLSSSFFGTLQRATGVAHMEDAWTFTGSPLDTSGMFRVGVHFDGTTSQSSVAGATVASSGRLLVQLGASNGVGGILDEDAIDVTITNSSVDNTFYSDAIDFLYGRSISVTADVIADVRLAALASVYSGQGEAQFGNTASFTVLEVFDPATGQWVSASAVSRESGATYPFDPVSAVPEPSSLCLALVGLSCGGWRALRRSRRTRAAEVA